MFIYELTKYNFLTLGSGGSFLNIGYKVTLNLTTKKIQHLFKILSYGKVKSGMGGGETLQIPKAQVWRKFKALLTHLGNPISHFQCHCQQKTGVLF